MRGLELLVFILGSAGAGAALGGAVCLLHFGRRREAERRALSEREELFRLLADNAHDVVYRQRLFPTEGFDYVSPSVASVIGYSPEEFYADSNIAERIVHPDDVPMLLEAEKHPEHLAGPLEVRWIAKDGRVVYTEQRNVPVHDASGRLLRVEGIVRDITARKASEVALLEAYERERAVADELRQLDDMKNAFLSAVSHELRTPLAAVLGGSVTLQRMAGELDPRDVEEFAGRVAANARKLERLLGDLLDLDRLRRGILEPRRVETDVGELVRRTVGETPTEGRLVLVQAPPLYAPVDASKVERIVENLVSNAVRHTPDGCRIEVRVSAAPEGVVIAVDDSGPGVPPELREVLFQPFRQGPQLRPHSPGTGIGLALVSNFAALHEGRAWIEDSASGGASFRVCLPWDVATAVCSA